MFAPEGERYRDRTGQTTHSLGALPDDGLHRSGGKLMQRRSSAYPPRQRERISQSRNAADAWTEPASTQIYPYLTPDSLSGNEIRMIGNQINMSQKTYSLLYGGDSKPASSVKLFWASKHRG
jgi:hypothetical protein